MEGFGSHHSNHPGGEYMALGKRPIIMPPMEHMGRHFENPNAFQHQQRFATASSSARYRDVPGELPLPSTIQNLDPALREKAIVVGKLVSRAASRVRRPGGQRPLGAFGEHFCQCGKDYMNVCGLNNHWKLSHKMPGKPPQLYVPASVQSKLLHGLDLTPFDLHSVQIQVSAQTLEMMAMPNRNEDSGAPWQQDQGMFPPGGWDGVPPQRAPFMGEMPGMMLRGPMHPAGHHHFGMADPRERMMPPGMMQGVEGFDHLPGMGPQIRGIPPPFSYDEEYSEWTENAKIFQSSVEAWLGEAGNDASAKQEADPGYEQERRNKEDTGKMLSSIIQDEEIWSILASAIIEGDRLLQVLGEENSHWGKLFFQTRHRQLSATQAISLFLITLRPKLSQKFYLELAAALCALIACLASWSEKKPAIDSASVLPRMMDEFGKDFYPQFLLQEGIVKSLSAFQLLGLSPASHQRLFSTLRLLCSFFELLGICEVTVAWATPAANDK